MNLDAQVERLSGLAAGLCLDARVRIEVGKAGWCYLPERRVIRVAADDLERRGADYCAGVLAHEVGHFHISRYHLLRADFPSRPVLNQVLNGIEDPRVNGWIKRRYPGTVPWFARLTAVDGIKPLPVRLPLTVWFGIESAREELIAWRPATDIGPLPPALADALDRTRSARRRYAETLPSTALVPAPVGADLAGDYRAGVGGRLETPDEQLPVAWEQAALVSSAAALAVAEAEVLPVAAELLAGDVNHLARHLERDPNAQKALRRALAAEDDAVPTNLVRDCFSRVPEPVRPLPPLRLRRLALAALEAWLRGLNRSLLGVIEGPDGDGLPVEDEAPPSGLPRPHRPRPPRPQSLSAVADYERVRAGIAAQIDRLVRDLEEVLRPRRRLRTRAGFATGQRIDLRRAMAFEADPRTYDRLWSRPTIPQRRDTAFMLLVDLSGSMRGPKSAAALEGTVLLAETLQRVGVPFAVNGFQDEVIPFCGFGEGLGLATRAALATMPREVLGDRPDGHNKPGHNDDGPCLLEAADDLLDWAATERVLLVVSDGLPEGRRSTPADLHAAVKELAAPKAGLELVGIGLGQGTGHVRDFYPESVADVPSEKLAEEIGRLLRKVLTRA